MLAQASMPLSYWPYVFQTATYLINRLSTLVLPNKSPYHTFYHKMPSYDHFKIFGCSCFLFLGPYNANKLQNRSRECVFIGYSTQHKSYLCLDPTTGPIYISRHVVFDESSLLFINHSSSSIASPSNTIVHILSAPLSSLSPSTTPTPTDNTNFTPSLTHFSSFPSQSSPASSSLSLPLSPNSPHSDSSFVRDLHVPCEKTKPPTNNDHPMVTRSKARIFKPKLFMSTFAGDLV
ncbi:hypothetical protein PanWU01x14_366100 [Parasponia andersonii]|uniref:Retroviral polymerase SH3-like domain-containing protein n=1 Tax=Parasponia andersonii TaxID=3476 RepID=A0A2P5A5R3_PARAD|nr:hypothetical protein PanWU01x14_366100 [Parasponia andersonii]